MHPDLPQEQAYFDRALALRDRQQAGLARAPSMAANPRAAVELRRRVSGLGLTDPDEAIAFGRIDTPHDRWYIGKGAIWGDDNELVVVNWQAPIAAPFYTATPDEPQGLDARRVYRCTGNQIREIEEVLFRAMAEAVVTGETPAPVLSDALLDALGSSRSGELGDIVATIQASQYEVISRELDQLLVVQGGPGTGKTVVGLHRVSWLLFNRRDRLEARDVLIVGPNPAFVRYISSVLPSLGEEAVVQLPLRALGPRVRIGRVDPPEVRRLKGDRRMLRLVLRGLRYRQRVEATPVELTVEGRRVELDGRRIATRARQLAGRPHNEAYRMLRAFLVGEVTTALGRNASPGTPAPTVQGEAARDIDNYLDRVWPSLTPQGLLVDLFSSRRQLLAAGAGSLSDAELDLLSLPSDAQVSTWQWSVDDIPLLDTADALLNGVRATYQHIVVDEAQDLSPLQLESIRRRSRTGSMTVLGDLAQGTSPWAHQSWETVVTALRHERVTATTVELEYGYRLPAEVHEVAMRLLVDTAPGLACPEALRSSGHEVAVLRAAGDDDLVPRTVAAVRDLVGEGIVGVITPGSARAALVAALDDDGTAWASELAPSAPPVVVLTPDEAKGLEFDTVVVVEPASIVEQSEHGLRSLFVALTRCTSRLALVHARPLPSQLGLGAPEPAAATHGMAGDPEPEPEPADRKSETAARVAAPEPESADRVAEPEPAAGGPEPAPAERESAQPEPAERDPESGPEGAEPAVPGEHEPAAPLSGAAVQPAPVATGESSPPAASAPEPPAPGPAAADSGVAGTREAEWGRPEPEQVGFGAGQAEPEVAALGDDDASPAVPEQVPPADQVPPAEQVPSEHPGPEVDVVGGSEPDAALHGGLAEQVVVSTPGVEADHVLDALGDLDRDIARAIARTVAAKLAHLLSPPLLGLVADELTRELQAARDVSHDAGPGDDPDGDPPGPATNGAARAREADVAPDSEVPAP
jgi:AAA domain/UvrD-like helicase C-terminal domain